MRRFRVAGVVLLALTVSACGNKVEPVDRSGSPAGASEQLTVFAASSLTAAFTQIGKDFEASDANVHVTFNFGPSDGLARQIESEGTADVFASASPTWMDDVQKKVGVGGRTDFAQNELVIITPSNNPAGIASIEDLSKPGVQLVLAAKGVPAGDYARQILANAGLAKAAEANIVSNEQDDASVVAKITAGEADVAIVYRSDVTAAVAPKVGVVEIPDNANVIATYPIAVVTGASDPELAQRFVDFVTGPGEATMVEFGFMPPP